MEDLKTLLDFLDNASPEVIFQNLKAIQDKKLKEKLALKLNEKYGTNGLDLEELRLYQYRKLTFPVSKKAIKESLEEIIKEHKWKLGNITKKN